MADRIFDFNAAPKGDDGEAAVSYSLFDGAEYEGAAEPMAADAVHPLLVLSEEEGKLRHHERGYFLGEKRRSAFRYIREDGSEGQRDIILLEKRLERLLLWIRESAVTLRLSGKSTDRGYEVYKLRIIDARMRTEEPTSADGLLQIMLKRLLSYQGDEDGSRLDEALEDEQTRISEPQEIRDFLRVAGSTLPRKIFLWARRNLNLLSSSDVSPDEKHHIKRALCIMLGIEWQGSYFPPIDPVRAREILDEELFGLDRVKQRIIETIIQINRTHTLPAYGILLVGPAGTGKSQIAYAVARILGLPWTSLDMSSIRDAEALTGSPRIYSNAKPGRIMEAFSEAGMSNLVFIINELDKAEGGGANGNPADALLTLLDNLGYTDNYIECVIPTAGVYPIATANDKSKIGEPLMTRFAVIEIPDYSPEEKKTIFTEFALPRTLKRIGMSKEECIVEDDALEAIIEKYRDRPGCRGLEQAAELLAANALYHIETEGRESFCFDGDSCRELLK